MQESLIQKIKESPRYGMNITFSGLTAAGKTTHSRILADQIGYKYISATDLLLNLTGVAQENEGSVWANPIKFEELEKLREGDKIDDTLEAILIEQCNNQSHTVFDTWALSWLSLIRTLRIWIESDRLSRCLKCMISNQNQDMSISEALKLIDKKDITTKDRFMRRHKFNLFIDHKEFEVNIENTFLIDDFSYGSDKPGIELFKQKLLESVYLVFCETELSKNQAEILRNDNIVRSLRTINGNKLWEG
jgi:cytidylate kinase